jgi:pyruvate dehydrogenase E1 component beta subunit
MGSLSYGNALTEAVREEMARDPRVVILGEDAAVGGALGLLNGLADEFGRDRVRDTPISEAGFAGAAIGLAATGWRPIVDLMFAPFIWCAMDQVCNQAAKWRYMSNGQAEMSIVYLMANGALGGEAAAQHAISPYSQFMQVPGLKIAIPSTARDAKGLTKTAIRDPNPVLLFEIPRLNGIKGDVPDGEFTVPMGEASVLREGTDITVVGIGYLAYEALQAAETLAGEGISVEVVDPRTLVPLDIDTIVESVQKTNRLIVADEATPSASAASEIIASVAELSFEYLDTYPARVCALNTPTPFSPNLEQTVLPDAARIEAAIREQVGQPA